MVTLQSGQIIKQQINESVSFLLPVAHVLLWADFEKNGLAWVIEAKPERLSEVLAAISKQIKTGGDVFRFVKYAFACDSGEKNAESNKEFEKSLDAELKKLGIKVEGKLVRAGTLHGLLDFKAKRLRIEKRIKLMIVDDSKTIRDLLSSIFSKVPEIEVVAVVDHPHKAQKLIPELKPDVITLDIHMPDMDGVTLLKSYIPKFPIPTIMISSLTMEEGPMVLNALESGAVDYIQKPSFSELAMLAPLMIEKVKEASRSKVKIEKSHESSKTAKFTGKIDESSLIVIGSSTGGTEALKQVFLSMPAAIPPTLVVQHIPPVFSKAFADRLNQLCPFEVREAKDGDLVAPNLVLIAPGGLQMEVVAKGSELRVKISDAAPMNRHKPSVDFLFDSLVKYAEKFNLAAVILTGMGADGARGLKALKDKGARTIAQDEASCVVFGMPKEAIRMGGVDFILPIQDIGAKIMNLASTSECKRA